MAISLTIKSVDRIYGDTKDLAFNIKWPPNFNGVDGRTWRVCVRSFAMPSSATITTPWVELRLRIGSTESYSTNNEQGTLTHIIPISAVTGQFSESWTEVQSLSPEIRASLHDSDGNYLAYQAPDKTITLPGDWICQLQFDPILRRRC